VINGDSALAEPFPIGALSVEITGHLINESS